MCVKCVIPNSKNTTTKIDTSIVFKTINLAICGCNWRGNYDCGDLSWHGIKTENYLCFGDGAFYFGHVIPNPKDTDRNTNVDLKFWHNEVACGKLRENVAMDNCAELT